MLILPDTSLHRLQLVQNAFARVVVPTVRRSHHISPILRSLHWLPIPQRITLRLLLSLSKHYRIINLPIFAIFSFLTVSLIHFALLTSICSPYLSSNLPKLVDPSSLLLQQSGILFLSLSVLFPPVHHLIPLLRLTFSLLRSTSSSIGILDFDPAPCMTLLWVTFGLSAWLA